MNGKVLGIYDPQNDVWGYPQKYKGIEFFPIKMKDTKFRNLFYGLFAYPKSYINDRDIVRMSYLKFLLYVIQGNVDATLEKINLYDNLIEFLKHITHSESIDIILEQRKVFGNPLDDLYIILKVNDVIFDEIEFDNMREIILEQNGLSIEYIEEYNPSLEEKLRFISRQSSDIDYKDEIFTFCALTKMTEEQVGERTLYQFKNRFERESILLEYNTLFPLEVTGQITSKTKESIARHYFSHISKKRRYADVLIDKNKFIENSGFEDVAGVAVISK